MSLTNRVTIAIEVYKDGAKLDGGSEALNALIATIPFAGGAITSILSGRAQHQMRERVNDVFEAFKERLEQMGAERIDKKLFRKRRVPNAVHPDLRTNPDHPRQS